MEVNLHKALMDKISFMDSDGKEVIVEVGFLGCRQSVMSV